MGSSVTQFIKAQLNFSQLLENVKSRDDLESVYP